MIAAKSTTLTGISLLLLPVFAALAADDKPAVLEEPSQDSDRVPLYTVVPVYPEKARRERLEGEVQVCYHIDKKGRPYRIAVRNSSHRVFEQPALLAVRASTYAPLEDGARSSGIKFCRTFRFTLEPVTDG